MQTNLTREKIPIASLPRQEPDVGFTGLFCQVRKASQLYIFLFMTEWEYAEESWDFIIYKGEEF